MGKPSWMPTRDWNLCKVYARDYNTYPELLAAIGWHETHWGRLGWGRKGFYLGVGCYSRTRANYNFQGLAKQLYWAAPRLGKYLDKNVTLLGLKNFARNVWKPGNPDAWAISVWRIYKSLGGPVGSGKKKLLTRKGTINIFPEYEMKSISTSLTKINDVLKSIK